MGITVAVTRVACDTGVGDQDITTADLDGLTPGAVFFVVSRVTVDGAARAHACIGIGAATGGAEQWAITIDDEDNVGTTDGHRRAMTDECVLILLDGSRNPDGEANFKEFITNGVRITWGNACASAWLLTAIFFAGTDLSAKADVKPGMVQDATSNIEDVGFEPDVLLTGSNGDTIDDSNSNQCVLAHGVVTNTDPLFQASWGFTAWEGVGTTAITSEITDNYGLIQVFEEALTYGLEFSAFDALGFSVTARLASAAADDFAYLALGFGGAVDVWAGIVDTPTDTGNQSQTGAGFTPQAVICGVTQMPAIDTLYTDANAGSVGVSAFDADDEYCSSIQDQDNVGTSNTQSLSDDTVVNLPDDDGTAAHVAAFVSFDSNGWTWNFSATEDPAVKYWALAIETGAVRIPRYGFTNFQIPGIV